jgi:hypothetical protein
MEEVEGDRHRDQHHAARREGDERGAVLHPEQEAHGAEAVRARRCANIGAIENRLHWQLDVTFGEDQCRIRKGHADTNFSILRRAALSLLKNDQTAKVGVKNKRLIAAWDDAYLRKSPAREVTYGAIALWAVRSVCRSVLVR